MRNLEVYAKVEARLALIIFERKYVLINHIMKQFDGTLRPLARFILNDWERSGFIEITGRETREYPKLLLGFKKQY